MLVTISIFQELVKGGWNKSERYEDFSKINKPGGGRLFCAGRVNVYNTKFGILSQKATLLTLFIHNLIHKKLGDSNHTKTIRKYY